MCIKNKRLLTSAKIRKISTYFFDFLKDDAMVHVCGNFVVCNMSLSNFIEEEGGGGRIFHIIMKSAKDQCKWERETRQPVSEIFSKKTFL